MQEEPTCEEQHTPAPSAYGAWHDWVRRMTKTHRQVRCTSCGLWKVWVPRKRREENR